MKYLIYIFLPVTLHLSVLSDINQIRSQYGLMPLRMNQELTIAAENHGQDFVSNNYFSHQGWTDFIYAQGYGLTNGCMLGENLSSNYTPSQAIYAWMNSPEHRVNILNPNFTETGIGEVNNYIIQEFGSC